MASLFDRFQEAFSKYADRPALAERDAPGRYSSLSYKDLGQFVKSVAGGLHGLGLKQGDAVALYSENRTEWLVTDLACLGEGIVTVPVHAVANPKDLEYILRHSEAKAIVTSKRYLPRVQAIAKPETLQHTILMDSAAEGTQNWYDLALPRKDPFYPKGSLLDTSTIIYTSGTTAEPKGAVMTQDAIWKNIKAISETFRMSRDGERIVSYLPLSHCYERFAGEYTTLLNGGSVLFSDAADKERLLADIQHYNPTIFLGVPRIYEKFYDGIQGKLHKLPAFLRKPFLALMKGRIRRKLFGKDVRFATSSAAALKPEIADFFRKTLGLTLLEAYGMTEAVSAITANTPADNVPGTVGKALPGYAVRLGPAVTDAGEDLTEYEEGRILKGEIQFTGPQMMGYHKNYGATQAMRTPDGWLRTGDIGMIEDGRLRIVGRAKEQFKLSNGKYIVPGELEDRLKDSPYVSQSFIYGDDSRKHVIGLIVPNEHVLRSEFPAGTLAELVEREDVRRLFADEVGRLFKGYEGFKKPTTFALLSEPFSIENNMLTPTLKLKRRVVADRYRDLVERLYAGAAGQD
jgi:long-chain acyl-CoA synthetase